MSRRIVNAGDRFGRLTILREVDKIDSKRAFKVRCDCGTVCIRKLILLTTGETRSCGCLFLQGNKRSHGLSKTPTYRIWQYILQRCENPNSVNFKNYGGRGIKVCQRWQSFENFLSDLGERPSPKHEISRIHNDGDYKPGNVEWSDDEIVQNRNKRTYRGSKTSKFRGVDRYRNKSWRVRIVVERGSVITLGYFKSEREAARAYDAEARKHPGFILNFPQ
jgi:hypothetical protein